MHAPGCSHTLSCAAALLLGVAKKFIKQLMRPLDRGETAPRDALSRPSRKVLERRIQELQYLSLDIGRPPKCLFKYWGSYRMEDWSLLLLTTGKAMFRDGEHRSVHASGMPPANIGGGEIALQPGCMCPGTALGGHGLLLLRRWVHVLLVGRRPAALSTLAAEQVPPGSGRAHAAMPLCWPAGLLPPLMLQLWDHLVTAAHHHLRFPSDDEAWEEGREEARQALMSYAKLWQSSGLPKSHLSDTLHVLVCRCAHTMLMHTAWASLHW